MGALKTAEFDVTQLRPSLKAHLEGAADIVNILNIPLTVSGVSEDQVKDMCLYHDIGYHFKETGQHTIDSVLWLQKFRPDFTPEMLKAILHHGCGKFYAKRVGHGELFEDLDNSFPDNALFRILFLILSYADLTTKGDGSRCTPEERVQDTKDRYGDTAYEVHTALKVKRFVTENIFYLHFR